MATLVPPVDLPRITESLEVAHTILRRKRDYDLVQKTMILQGYLELSQMNPDRSYDDKIRKASDDLTALIHCTHRCRAIRGSTSDRKSDPVGG